MGTLLGGLIVVALPRLPASPGEIAPPWWLFAIGFAICEVWPFWVRIGRGRQLVSLGGLPLVVGLFALTPCWLLVARVAGTAAVFAVLRSRSPLRAAFGLARAILQTALAAGAMWALGGRHDVLTVRGWWAALVAVTVAEALDGFVLLPGGRLHHRWAGPSASGAADPVAGAQELTRSLTIALLVGSAGLVVTTVLALGPKAVWHAVPTLVAGVLGYRLYLLLLVRREGQEHQLRFSEQLGGATEVDAVAQAVVDHVVDLFGTRRAELVIGRSGRFVGWLASSDAEAPWGASDGVASAGVGGGLPLTPAGGLPLTPAGGLPLTPAGGLPLTPAGGLPLGRQAGRPAGPWAGLPTGRARAVRDGDAVLAAAGLRVTRGQSQVGDRLLEARDLQEAVVLRLGVGDGMSAALLVGERARALMPGFRDVDIQLMRTVANQAALALRHAVARKRLRHEATHDQLTGLPNSQQFRRQALQAVTEAATLGPPCAVGVLDLDGFKTVNDSLGHLAGDAVLAEVGRRMAALNRVGLQVSRLGGDEFAVLVRGVHDDAEAVTVTRRLLDSLHEPFEMMGDQVRLTGSLGLALAPRDGFSPEQLLRHADVAMSAAKEEASGVRVYARELTEMLDAPLSLAADLRLALARGDVTIAVQPLVDLATGRLHSVEALARWRHPVLGVVNPEAFVMAAERVGLVGELTDVVIDQALRACQAWLAGGLEVQVAVNLAARTLSDPDLPVEVEAALRRYGVPGRLLCFELTETGVISSPDRALAVLDRLRALGVQLAVDDFGTGYSSMTYMNWLAPDQVKIDKSFVQRLRFDPRNEAIVRSIIDLANNLGVDVVAEGICDARTATRLADLGCTIGQGFLFAEPMLTSELPDWVARWMSVPERDAWDDQVEQIEQIDQVEQIERDGTAVEPCSGLAQAVGTAGGGGSAGGSRGEEDGDEGEVRLRIVR